MVSFHKDRSHHTLGDQNLGQWSGFRTFASDGYSDRSSSDFSFGSLRPVNPSPGGEDGRGVPTMVKARSGVVLSFD
jgi:hypothetical protein